MLRDTALVLRCEEQGLFWEKKLYGQYNLFQMCHYRF